MNYKLLFPTYRNRYLFIRENLKRFGASRNFSKGLNLGTGEGDYDPMIAAHCEQLISCDINEHDIAFAKKMNAATPNLNYRIEDALRLSFPDDSFNLLTSVDVMEHVGKPQRMTEEIGRVLMTGGLAFITFPQTNFPFTYDPINRLLGKRAIAQGAYAFGHEYLVDPVLFKQWAEQYGMEVLEEKNLSGYLIGLLEMYWTGMIQRHFKENAGNVSGPEEKKGKLRPSVKEPMLTFFTDLIIKLDFWFFKNSKYSVGKGFIVRKK
ncbi:MAG: class I SAM-dependent methyltransferase [Saprospiraceae bacterium]|nr:class I SAM-dependent methyltransferase [Saprospiraceae bacterium]MCF8248893.1 class I SAM-dependent methyltransferase [Saprospiraceae bacterium]MCF8279618.1 class I SAM-dependent methyltransferase [Bacteroidales bacterium]MCF8310178.1 class I SAM-dependent methyltransferase [Saprospiraceae bacterium]MCF8439078.1 class I SAM-dependent methyltransferase [Saprospiraceae bacterium]